ncbi:acylphosphatase [Loigolactobacillus backii]|uniref:acylphosphatase n=1 Tax=Loigolactobacillus backii TaxID=375175 RepID=A0A192H436_9LACO|nr:acylphosphatase [Loigolactobacillus backii]ANK59318.1 acylphosphatase [Loigolactobacillus backii]ANK62731.1 acylphosphatase [Loigolactobacillus backii]ANK64310.1 acylphosphatase [Loigolactobacillus backii]ANK67295.1 acylphosphatase [Loigolactobacillus backii]ANK70261.1 acylphosphatase [Loigolactobacillus backii]
MRTVQLTVFGRVQGVGFRFSTKRLADKIGVSGIVRNLIDGSVYIEASGSNKQIEKFISSIKASPSPYGKVTRVDLEEIKPSNYHGFQVTD